MGAIKSFFGILPSMIILLFVFGGAYYLNEKLNKMNNMWLSANQITVKNQQAQIKINRAFGKQRDKFTSYIHGLPEDDRKVWLAHYSEEVEMMLYTPPKGLKNQSGEK